MKTRNPKTAKARMATIYWYAPKYRPPSFATMPDKGTFVAVDKTIPGKPFMARAYSEKLSDVDVESFQLELVETQES